METLSSVSQLAARTPLRGVVLGSAAALMFTAMAAAQASTDARRILATHDYTTTAGAAAGLREVWVDVKTPGARHPNDARTYAVGTIELESNDVDSKFSGEDVRPPVDTYRTFNLNSGTKQVVILQCRLADESIAWQRYFYGETSVDEARFTNARAVSVWPAEDPEDVRIAICGETAERRLPFSQLTTELANANASDPTGFLAVFDGAGVLKWSHQFYGHSFSQRCAITDLSIRVEQEGETTYDVVTYCGISTHGNYPGATTPLTPLLPFDAPVPAQGSSYVGAGGGTDNGLGTWDGIFGRLQHDRAGGTTSKVFHSVLGGSEMDGSFGLAALTEDRYAVVGNTTRLSSAQSAYAFPFTHSTADWNNVGGSTPAYSVGTLTLFDASPTRSGNKLSLTASYALGRVGSSTTIARDVAVREGSAWSPGLGFFGAIVGTTDDWSSSTDNLITNLASGTGTQGSWGGGFDGFLATLVVQQSLSATNPVIFLSTTFHGGTGDDGLNGVAMVQDDNDRYLVTGQTDSAGNGGHDLVVAEYDHNAYLLRSDVIGGSNIEASAPMGQNHATTGSFGYLSGIAGVPAGGGVDVDGRGRVTVVGSSLSAGQSPPFPNFGASNLGPLGGVDGVRATFDMLPPGVWRTDGTGTRASVHGTVPQPSGYNGGITPAACVSPFGHLPGAPGVPVTRGQIRYQGPDPAGGASNVLISSRIQATSTLFIGAVMQVGFPGSPGSDVLAPNIEFWTPTNPSALIATATGAADWLIFPTGAGMPSGSYEFTIQAIYLLTSPLSCDTGATLGLVASPGLVISY